MPWIKLFCEPWLLGTTRFELTHEERAIFIDREKFNENVKKYGFLDGEEFEYKRKDGSTFWGRISDRAFYDRKGKVKYWDGTVEDITERKKLEDALKKSGTYLGTEK